MTASFADLPWIDAALARLADARASAHRVAQSIEALGHETNWRSRAAEGYHERRRELAVSLHRLQTRIDVAEYDLLQQLARVLSEFGALVR